MSAPKKRRSRSGCLTCRWRKVKCDETWPCCLGCRKSSFKCKWPSPEKKSLSHGEKFQLERVSQEKEYQFVIYKGDAESSESERSPEEPAEAPVKNDPWVQQQPVFEMDGPILAPDEPLEVVPCHELDDEAFSLTSPMSLMTPTADLANWGMELITGTENSFYLKVYVDGFLKSISPQVCHPSLSPGANFMPHALQNPVMMDVVNACASSFLSRSNPDMMLESKKRYSICLRNFANVLANAGEGVEEWMAFAVILLCLRDKFSGASPAIPASHLAKALEMIRHLRDSGKSSITTLKFLAETYLFNYTVMLLTTTEKIVQKMPSPFDVYMEWRDIIDFSPFPMPLPFMKYPIFGAARHTFEIAAKVSWLYSRLPLTPLDKAVACDLLREVYTMELPIIPIESHAELSPGQLKHSQESIILADILNNCCILLLHKLIFPSLEKTDPSVQNVVITIISRLHELSAESPIWIVCTWPLLVCGIAASTASHQHYIYSQCRRCIYRFQMGFLENVCKFLVSVWGTETEQGLGWDCLLNREVLSRVYL